LKRELDDLSPDGPGLVAPPTIPTQAIGSDESPWTGSQNTRKRVSKDFYVLEGELDTEIRDGRTFKLLPG